jgi:glycosyltransferase involved in cell wall biosynthesis
VPGIESIASPTTVHIGLNLLYLVPGETGGMEVYARELIPRLVAAAPQHQFTAFVNREAKRAGDGPWGELIGMVTVPVDATSRIHRVRAEQLLLPIAARRQGIDLLHSLASTAPGWGPYRQVVTIHDLIYATIPESHPGIRSRGMRALVPMAARRSDRIITDSRATADDVERFIGIDPAKLDVVPLGVGTTLRATPLDGAELRDRLECSPDRELVLTVSAKLPHKNLLRLLGALASIERSQRPLLVLPGYPTPHEQELRSGAAELGIDDDVRFLGWISAAELEGLYAAASCFVFPSLAEGFGLPVLEAMVRGVPVACSARGSLAEVVGDAALLFDPESEPAIADAIRAVLGDPALRERLRQAGRTQAARFTWSATADGTLASYERTLSIPAAGDAQPAA